jgi:hypothetical protein
MNVLYVNIYEFVHEGGDQTKKKNYEKRTEISVSLAFLTLPMEKR